jgi:hypothetical protein
VESKWKNYHIITFPGQSLSKTLEEAMDLSQDRLILELELVHETTLCPSVSLLKFRIFPASQILSEAVIMSSNTTYKCTLAMRSIEETSFGEANSCSASHEIPCLLCNLLVHKSLPLAPAMSQINPVHTLLSYFSLLHLHLIICRLFPSEFATKVGTNFSFLPCVLHDLPTYLTLV